MRKKLVNWYYLSLLKVTDQICKTEPTFQRQVMILGRLPIQENNFPSNIQVLFKSKLFCQSCQLLCNPCGLQNSCILK